MKKMSLILAMAAGLSGCATGGTTSYRPSAAAYPTTKTTAPGSVAVKNDPYSPMIEVATEEAGERGSGDETELYGLYAKVQRGSAKTVSYVQWSEVYNDRDWRFYNRASNSKGQALQFSKIDRKVTGCSGRLGSCTYSETYNIYLPRADLRAGAATGGISFKIYSQTGKERVIDLPAPLLAEFNAKLTEATSLATKNR